MSFLSLSFPHPCTSLQMLPFLLQTIGQDLVAPWRPSCGIQFNWKEWREKGRSYAWKVATVTVYSTCKDRARARCRTWGRGKGKWVSGIREDTEKGRRKTSVEILCKGEAIEDEEDRKRLRGTQREEMREKGQKGRKKGGNDIDIRGKNTRDWRRKCRRNVLRWKWVIEGEGGGPQEKWQEGRSTTVKAVRSTIKGRIEELWC